ncbi:MAG: hypothetical protein Kow0092_35950 [Deferrisomatales bacterium]
MSSQQRVKVAKNGRMVIPAAYRKALRLSDGGEVILRLRDGLLELEPAEQALARAREAVRKYAGTRDLVEELLRERREEASHE